ncbi:hypothetical protein BJ508DRAFT_215920 [Ascobolus immersus RN42]|uniref:Endoplasmic reticulum protein n=1 Tax=Ascobolus immersus RN42 TaxID=1160509 RepID=A0A3N4HLP7_ASCIM|nr:hypothetical protein BJ508DRAFT_215920 [Ascobolus immersus RN42]
MAPPAVNHQQPLQQRVLAIAQTLQFGWFIGHLLFLLSTLRYTFAAIKFNTSSTGARFSYRLAFISAAVTYGIVVFKAYKARAARGTGLQPQALLADENVQYLILALVWLFSKPIFYALLPYAVYSTFHFLTYLRTNLLPALMPPPPAAAAAAGAVPADGSLRKGPQPPLAEAIGRFVKQNYDASMHLVSRLELALWARVFFGTLIFSNSWILLVVYSVFVRVRYAQSQFMRSAVAYMERFFDGLLADQRVPAGVRNGWGAFKGVIRTVGDKTDFGKKTQ